MTLQYRALVVDQINKWQRVGEWIGTGREGGLLLHQLMVCNMLGLYPKWLY